MGSKDSTKFDERCWYFCEEYLKSRSTQNVSIYLFVIIPIFGGIGPFGITYQIRTLWIFLLAYIPILIIGYYGFNLQKKYSRNIESKPHYVYTLRLFGFYQFLNFILSVLLYYDSVILLREKGDNIVDLFSGNEFPYFNINSIIAVSSVVFILILVLSILIVRKVVGVKYSSIGRRGHQKLFGPPNVGIMIFWFVLILFPLFLGLMENSKDVPIISGYVFMLIVSYFLLFDSIVKTYQLFRARNWVVNAGKM